MDFFELSFNNAVYSSIDEQQPQSSDSPELLIESQLPDNNPNALDVLDKYAGDIARLSRHFGHLESGQTYELTLQEMLKICCERSRKRIDAFDGLVNSALQDRLRIKLVITSNKTK